MALGGKLSPTRQALLDEIYNIVLDVDIWDAERQLFLSAKNRIEWGHNFDTEMNELLSAFMYCAASPRVVAFCKKARDLRKSSPTIGGSIRGFWP